MPFGREEQVFETARRIRDARERSEFVDKATAGNGELRRSVEELLSLIPLAEKLFVPISEWQRKDVDVDNLRQDASIEIAGRFRLLKKIGEGAFGTVYAAEQKAPVTRQVAVKILKAGLDTKQVVARFEAERQALALMDHPHIAKVLDGGATEQGRPYFVMELVKGVSLNQFCDEACLLPRQRVELFLQVCGGVEHAHQKGIIHRDLKPSNILVTAPGGKPVAKIIDFGIAKATQQELTDKTIFTQLHQFIGTPAYISPEQAQMTNFPVDTRADIYSLGSILYELLAGRTPFEGGELLAGGLDEMRRRIREEEPERPSTRVTLLSLSERVAAARQRGLEASEWIRALRGDLDWIIMKCLEKDPDRRYATANALAVDLERYLHEEPISARPPSAIYRLRKFVRRNRAASAATLAITLALLGAITASSWALLRERQARNQADQQLHAALAFVSTVAREVTPALSGVVGISQSLERLASAQLAFLDKLRARGSANPDMTLHTVELLIELSKTQGSILVNSSGDFGSALTNLLKAIELLKEVPSTYQPARQANLRYDAEHRVKVVLHLAGRHGETFAREAMMEAALAELERFPEFRSSAPLRRVLEKSNSAHALNIVGKPEAALRQLAPLLEAAWVRNIDRNSGSDELSVLSNLHAVQGVAHELLREPKEMLRASMAALEWREILAERFPGDNRHKPYEVEYRSMAGLAYVLAGDSERGWAMLDQAKRDAEALFAKDEKNDRVRSPLGIVRWRMAKAKIALASGPSQPPEIRQQHLRLAEDHLLAAEGLLLARPTRIHVRLLAETRREFDHLAAASGDPLHRE